MSPTGLSAPPATPIRVEFPGLGELEPEYARVAHDALRITDELLDVLARTHPLAHDRTVRVHSMVVAFRRLHRGAGTWEVELAAALCSVGMLTVPSPVLARWLEGRELTIAELTSVADIDRQRDRMIQRIPGAGGVLSILRGASVRDADAPSGLPFGSRLLRILCDIDTYERRGFTPDEIGATMRADHGAYDADVLELVLAEVHRPRRPAAIKL